MDLYLEFVGLIALSELVVDFFADLKVHDIAHYFDVSQPSYLLSVWGTTP